MSTRVLVLNYDYSYVNIISWQDAMKLMCLDKVEVIKFSDKKVRTTTRTFYVPLILRLIKLVRVIFRNRVPFNPKNIFIRDGHKCQYCGSNESLTVDHVIPRSRGGQNEFENCVTCCYDCNNKKGDRTPREAGMTLMKNRYDQPTIMEFLTKKLRKMGADELISVLNVYGPVD